MENSHKKKDIKKSKKLSSICKACGACPGDRCAALQADTTAFLKKALPKKVPQNYPGMRFTADAFDCAMPIAIDSHSGCTFACLYCEELDAPIYMADGSFKQLGYIKKGEKIYGVSSGGGSKKAVFQIATVEDVFHRVSDLVSVTTESGRELICTPDHRWKIRNGWNPGSYQPAKIGRNLRFIVDPVESFCCDRDYKLGYLHGIAEGDGNHKKYGRSVVIRIVMKDEEALERVDRYSNRFGIYLTSFDFKNDGSTIPGLRGTNREAYNLFNYKSIGAGLLGPLSKSYWRGWLAGIYDAEGTPGGSIRISQYPDKNPKTYKKIRDSLRLFGFAIKEEKHGIRILGGLQEKIRFFATVRPAITRKFSIAGKGMPNSTEQLSWDKIVSVEKAGRGEVIGLKTSTGNYIAQGYWSRNCFSNSYVRDPSRNTDIMKKAAEKYGIYRQTSLRSLERLLSREADNDYSRAVYPLLDRGQPIQWGALGEPFDHLEQQTGWGLKAIKLFKKYNQPVRISTKGAEVLLLKKYRKAFSDTNLFWFSFSFISANDRLLKAVDIGAPDATTRYKAMKMLSDQGCPITLRFRPFIPGISDKWKGEPEGWKVHLEKAREAGARAISFEYIFFERGASNRQLAQYRLIAKIARNPNLLKEWVEGSVSFGTCIRSNRERKYEITMKIINKCKELGLLFCSSDPHFKEYNESGCCCGIPDDDPVFGGWERKNAGAAISSAKTRYDAGERPVYVYLDDVLPDWAKQVRAATMINFSSAENHRKRRDQMWADTIRNKWNNPNHARAPYYYFEGALHPDHLDDNGDIVYKYIPWTMDAYKKTRLVLEDKCLI